MPTLAANQATIDTEIVPMMTGMNVQQNTYKTNHGGLKFFQGLTTATDAALPDNLDAGLIQIVAQTLTGKPTDQSENWTAVSIAIPGTMHYAMTIDTYGGPLGQGWVLNAHMKQNGVVYSRSVNSGPETYRDKPWAQV
jgi:hypothetical protein